MSFATATGALIPSNLYAVVVLVSVETFAWSKVSVEVFVEHEARRREAVRITEARSIIDSSIFLKGESRNRLFRGFHRK